jgi:Icc-related predicted phosphoesterase
MTTRTRKILFCGDLHGNLHCAEKVIKFAVEQQITEVIQVGDFGFVWPRSDAYMRLSLLLIMHNVKMRWCCGNHEDHDYLQKIEYAESNIAPNITYQPRGSTYTDEDGTRFVFCGGAPSIDRRARVPGLSWWPEEEISEREYNKAWNAQGPFHVLVTHDAPDLPPGFHKIADDERFERAAARSQYMIKSLIEKHTPIVHFHGHFHKKYTVKHKNGTVTEGLAAHYQPLHELTMIWQREK